MSPKLMPTDYQPFSGAYLKQNQTPKVRTVASASVNTQYYTGSSVNPASYTDVVAGMNGVIREQQPTFTGAWEHSMERWGIRRGLGDVVDKVLQTVGLDKVGQEVLPEYARQVNHLNRLASKVGEQSLTYRQWMNLGKSAEELQAERLANPGKPVFEYHTVSAGDVTKNGAYWKTVKLNFRNAFQASEATAGEGGLRYLANRPIEASKRLLTSNFKTAADTLKEGKNIGAGLASVAGLLLLAYDIYSGTRDAYQYGKAQEDGSLLSKWKTAGLTAKGFLLQSIKAIAAWEASTVGYAVGAALLCIAIPGAPLLLPIIGGIVVGALAAVGTRALLNKVLPTVPKLPDPASATA